MTHRLLHRATYLATAGLVACSMGCFFASTTPKYRTIIVRPAKTITVPLFRTTVGVLKMDTQPEGQTVVMGSNAAFSAVANVHPFFTNDVSYQWQINPVQLNGNLYWTNLPDATNSTLVITDVKTNDVGYYRVMAQAGSASATSVPVPLVMCVFGSLTVIGTPVVSSGGKAGCCNPFIGYVLYPDYTNSLGGWGFIPINPNSPASVADLNRHSTIVEGDGSYGDGPPNLPCKLTTWTVDAPIPSPGYGITVYFPGPSPPNPAVPTGNYALTLGNNFKP